MSKLSKLVEKTQEYAEGRDRAVFCREKVVPAMEALREPVDELEMIVDKEMWPMHLMEILYLKYNEECYNKDTVHAPLSREVFWHEYAKIPRHTSQNSIAASNLE